MYVLWNVWCLEQTLCNYPELLSVPYNILFKKIYLYPTCELYKKYCLFFCCFIYHIDSKTGRLINTFQQILDWKKDYKSTLNLERNRLCDKNISREIKLFLLASFSELFLTSCGCWTESPDTFEGLFLCL